MARSLSVVNADTPRPRRPRTLKAAAEMSERDLLVAMRTKVAADIDAGVPSHALAPLIRQLRDLDKDIRLIDAEQNEGGDDVSKAAATPDVPWDGSEAL